MHGHSPLKKIIIPIIAKKETAFLEKSATPKENGNERMKE